MKDTWKRKYKRNKDAASDEESEHDEPLPKFKKLAISEGQVPQANTLPIFRSKRPMSEEDLLRATAEIEMGSNPEHRKKLCMESSNRRRAKRIDDQALDSRRVLWKMTAKDLLEIDSNCSTQLQMLFVLSVNCEESMESVCKEISTFLMCIPCPFNLLEDILMAIRGGIGVSPFQVKSADKILRKDAWRRTVEAACASFFALLYFRYSESVLFEKVVKDIITFCHYQVLNTIGAAMRIAEQHKTGFSNASHKIPEGCTDEIPQKDVQRLYKIVTSLTNILIDQYNSKINLDCLIYLMIELAVLSPFAPDLMNMRRYSLYLARKIVKDHQESLPFFINKIISQASQCVSQHSPISYLLDSGKRVQMSTVLILQLIQTSVVLSEKQTKCSEKQTRDMVLYKSNSSHFFRNVSAENASSTLFEADDPVLKLKMYKAVLSLEAALKTAEKIVNLVLSNFFEQCNKKIVIRHDSIFQEFLEDLLTLLHEPDWPASEYVLMKFCTFLGKILSLDDTPASLFPFILKCLGTILKGFHCDLSSSELSQIQTIVRHLKKNRDFCGEQNSVVAPEQNLVLLQKTLLATLIRNRHADFKIDDICQFYLAVWFSDIETEKSKSHFVKAFIFQQFDGKDMEEAGMVLEALNKKLVVGSINKIRRKADISELFVSVIFDQLLNGNPRSKRAFVHVANLLDATVNAKILPSAFEKVKQKCFDSSSVVRRAAVGYLVTILDRDPTEIDAVCNLLLQRVFDINLCVESRAIDALATICRRYGYCSGIWEMCVSTFGANSKESRAVATHIVTKTMSVEPVSKDGEERCSDFIEESVSSLINIFASGGDDNFEETFLNRFCRSDKSNQTVWLHKKVLKRVIYAIKRKVCGYDAERSNAGMTFTRRILACVKILNFISKTEPDVIISSNLNWRIFSRFIYEASYDLDLTIATANLFAVAVPLSPLEEKVAFDEVERGCYRILSNCDNTEAIVAVTRCLGAITKSSRCYDRIRAFAASVYINLKVLRQTWEEKKFAASSDDTRHFLKRTLVVLGVILMNFDFDKQRIAANLKDFPDKVLSECFHLCFSRDADMSRTALFAVGCVCLRYYWLAVDDQIRFVYQEILTSGLIDYRSRVQVITNINELLSHLLNKVSSLGQRIQTSASARLDPPGTLVDRVYEISSALFEAYYVSLKANWFHSKTEIRKGVLAFNQLALQLKVAHQLQIIPYLVCMASDPDCTIRDTAERDLREMEKVHRGLTFRGALEAVNLSVDLHRILEDKVCVPRGYFVQARGAPVAKIHVLYSIISSSEMHQALFISNLLQEFEATKFSLRRLHFLADNIAYFRYNTRGDVISVVRLIDNIAMISCDMNLIRSFRRILLTPTSPRQREIATIRLGLRVLLLLELRKHLCRLYGVSRLEMFCFSRSKSYRVKVRFCGKSIIVTNKTDPKMVPKMVPTIFDPFWTPEESYEEENFALGYSRSSLWHLLCRVEKLRENFGQNA